MVEVSPRNGEKILQPVIELLSGDPIRCLRIYRTIRDRSSGSVLFLGTGFGIPGRDILFLFIMILPTVTTMTVDALRAVPRHYREASLAS